MKPFSKCEQCDDEHHIVLLEHRKENSVVIGFIQCPSCQHKTVCSVTTPHIRSLQKRIRTIRNQYGKAKRLKKAERLLAEYEKANVQIQVLMQPLIDQENNRINQ